MRTVGILWIVLKLVLAEEPFIDDNEFGLKDEKNNHCLVARFDVELINFNVNSTNNRLKLDLKKASIGGHCAKNKKGSAILTASMVISNRRRNLKFYFHAKHVMVKQFEELRWEMRKVVYEESYGDSTVSFESANSSVVISAPLKQRFVCKDLLNITLRNPDYENVVLQFLPEIDIQPYSAEQGQSSNLYVCERTRKRSLAESFDSKMTIFSGVVLGLASIGMLVGHSVRRQMMPTRKREYEELAGRQ